MNQKRMRWSIAALLLLLLGAGGMYMLRPDVFVKPQEEKLKESFSIKPPLPGKEVAFEEFEWLGEDTVYFTKDGSKIHCEDLCLSQTPDQEQSAKIMYRQYNDAVDVYLSGIPMTVGKEVFESAGMFEIRAEVGGAEVKLCDGAQLKVEMASGDKATDYNQYLLNDSTGEWSELGKDSIKENEDKVSLRERIKKFRKPRKMPFDKGHFVFNYYALLDVYYKDKVPNDIPKKMERRFKRYNLNWYHLYNNLAVNYRGKDYPAAFMVWKTQNGQQPDTLERGYTYLTHLKGKKYRLKHYDYKTKDSAVTVVEAVMPLKQLLGKSASKWINDYEQAIAAQDSMQAHYEKMQDVVRVFSVAEFGIYNSDRFLKQENPVTFRAEFQLPEVTDSLPMEWVYVSGSQRSIIKFGATRLPQFVAFVKENDGAIIGVNNRFELFHLDKEGYKTLVFQEGLQPEHEVVISMAKHEELFENGDQLKELLGIPF